MQGALTLARPRAPARLGRPVPALLLQASGRGARSGASIRARRTLSSAPRAFPYDDPATAAARAAAAEAARLAAKYGAPAPPPPPPPPARAVRRATNTPSSSSSELDSGNGTFFLIAVNVAVFLLARFSPLPVVPALALVHSAPHAWQFVTCAFTHYDYAHLAGNLFSLLVFGRMVEEEEGAVGVVLTYIVCGAAAAAASYAALPSASISLGASGSVFGLFIVAVGAKLRPSLKKLTESAVLGAYVWSQIKTEVAAQAAVMGGKGAVVAGGGVVSHVAHLGGALAGVLLLALLARLPAAD
jgi:membrane associated rhomboid family serine protease